MASSPPYLIPRESVVTILSLELAVELSIRILSTAAIVIGITLAVERLGPRIGGSLAGLPIVIGPAFFFILHDHTVVFSADAATATLMSLSASQAFLMGYIVVAARSRKAILVATVAWAAFAWTLSWLPASPWLALLIFMSITIAVRSWTKRYARAIKRCPSNGTHAQLILRGIMAGLLVAAVTVASDWLGPVWAGFLVAYPIGLTVISMTIHQRSGADMVVVTLRAIMSGISSLAAFAFVLAILIEPLGPSIGFIAAASASVVLTIGLVYAATSQ